MKKILVLVILLQAGLIVAMVTGHSPFKFSETEKGGDIAKTIKTDVIPEVKVSEAVERASGIRVQPLAPAGLSLSDAPWGSVLPVVGLTESRMKIERAQLDVAQGTLQLERSHIEADRLEAAYKDGGNVARKLVEQAKRDEIEAEQKLKAARRVLETTREGIRAEWGATLLMALEEAEGGVLAPVLRGNAQLLLIAETSLEQGQVIAAEDPTRSVAAHRIAPAIQLDPGSRKPGAYWIASSPDFKVGLRVRLLMPKKSNSGSAHIPESAVLWQTGSSWVYVEREPHVFIRTRVTLQEPDLGGWVARSGVSIRDRVVVEGAQLLLSEESKAQIRNENGD